MILLQKQQSKFGEGKKTNCDIITEAIKDSNTGMQVAVQRSKTSLIFQQI